LRIRVLCQPPHPCHVFRDHTEGVFHRLQQRHIGLNFLDPLMSRIHLIQQGVCIDQFQILTR
jgi:hypothetical protein